MTTILTKEQAEAYYKMKTEKQTALKKRKQDIRRAIEEKQEREKEVE